MAQPTSEVLPELNFISGKPRPEIECLPLVQAQSWKKLAKLIGSEALGVPAIAIHLLHPFHKQPFFRPQRPVQSHAGGDIQRNCLSRRPTAEINRNNLVGLGGVVQ